MVLFSSHAPARQLARSHLDNLFSMASAAVSVSDGSVSGINDAATESAGNGRDLAMECLACLERVFLDPEELINGKLCRQ